MRSVVLATAGHIDHGKTELTRALTGIDTDRLPEEKARGITIDLGFAHFLLGDHRVAVIDVPGHERFVKNMLAGIGGVDLALLVVAADESVMPQTREHAAILELMGVSAGVVAINKCDLVDDEILELVRLEVDDLLEGTPLESAPRINVSARTGAGVADLTGAIENALARIAEHDSDGPFRLHVDRAFTVRGFGSVATGTVVSGEIAVGHEIEVQPGGASSKVRGIEVHGQEVESARAGARAALNLAGLTLAELARGDQLVTPRLFQPTSLVDVWLRLLAQDGARIKDMGRVRVHLGSAEILARVKLLGGSAIASAGESVYAQLRLERPLLVWPEDRFIVRSYSPSTTIGGGLVVDVPERKHRGRSDAIVVRLEGRKEMAAEDRVVQLIADAGKRGVLRAELVRRTGLLPAVVAAAIAADPSVVAVEGTEGRCFVRVAWEQLCTAACELLRSFHAEQTLLEGMSREEWRTRLTDDSATGRKLLDDLVRDGRVRKIGDLVALASHRVSLTEPEQRRKDALEQKFKNAGLNPPTRKDALRGGSDDDQRLLKLLVREGRLVALQNGALCFHSSVLEELKKKLRESAGELLTVGRFKELTGTSRKHAIPLLEHLDAVRFTRRQGDARIVTSVTGA